MIDPERPNVTRGEQMLALRKRRMAASHPFLRGGFRPFFLGAATWAVVAILLWLLVLGGAISLPTRFDAVAWHRHEMLFGFVGAAVSGFLLTAIPNWTGRLPIAGRPLLSLFGLWAGARLAVLFSSLIGFWPAAILDVGLYLSLALLAAREVVASKNRNLPIVGLVLLFGLSDAADYAQAAGLVSGDVGWRAAIALVIIMISLIGGRIIPSFTRNWMVKQKMTSGLPTQPQGLDLVVIASSVLALLFWLAFPDQHLTGLMLLLAAAAQALRLSRWSGYRTARDPLVLVLHLGYAWIPIGLFLLGLATAGFDVPRSAGVHALTAGAMSTMILAVMSRASLGHTARELKASPMTVGAYACVTIGALVRVAGSLGLGPYPVMLDVAGAFWGFGLILFVIVYQPILWSPRVGEPR
ncbi:MAG TPA: NnrS family protein [Sphingomicrobium sp.]|nr:NnrS family protein [Sphingomicrobium sp.]